RPTRTCPLTLTKDSMHCLPSGTVTLPLILVTAGWPPMRPEQAVSPAAACGGAARSGTAADRAKASAKQRRVVIGVLTSGRGVLVWRGLRGWCAPPSAAIFPPLA